MLKVKSSENFKGGFYSEGVDEFVISSNRQTSLFSWAWILNFWDFKGLKFLSYKGLDCLLQIQPIVDNRG